MEVEVESDVVVVYVFKITGGEEEGAEDCV